MYLESLAKNIRLLREDRGLTQKQFASSLSVSDKTISKWETCKSMPDIVALKLIATVYSVSIDSLVGIETKSK